MDHLRLAWQAGETLLSNVPFEEDPKGTRYNILLALQELLTNVLRHGLMGDCDETIVVRLDASDSHFGFEIHDRGPRFDPTAYQGEPDSCDGVPEQPGGYGLTIVRVVLDGFEYRHEDGWNIVRGTKSVRTGIPTGELA